MKLVDISVIGKTKIGSHQEDDKTVNDYAQASVVVQIPENISEDVEYFGADKYAHYARERILTRVADKVRAAVVEARESNSKITPEALNQAAQEAVATFPSWLGTRRREAGPKKSTKERNRTKALSTFEATIGKPYDKWSEKQKSIFNANYLV